MGSPVSVTVANLVIEDIEEQALATHSLQPIFWKRHIDDTLTALPGNQIKQFHQHINSIEPTIQFTIEEESNGFIPFLDTRVVWHDDSSLLTTVFRKQIHTDRYLDFMSHHPLAHKAAVVQTLLISADKVCTFVTEKDAEREHVSRAEQNNGYPRSIVDRNQHPIQPSLSPHKSKTLPMWLRPSCTSNTCRSPFTGSLTPWASTPASAPTKPLRQTLVYLKDHILP